MLGAKQNKAVRSGRLLPRWNGKPSDHAGDVAASCQPAQRRSVSLAVEVGDHRIEMVLVSRLDEKRTCIVRRELFSEHEVALEEGRAEKEPEQETGRVNLGVDARQPDERG